MKAVRSHPRQVVNAQARVVLAFRRQTKRRMVTCRHRFRSGRASRHSRVTTRVASADLSLNSTLSVWMLTSSTHQLPHTLRNQTGRACTYKRILTHPTNTTSHHLRNNTLDVIRIDPCRWRHGARSRVQLQVSTAQRRRPEAMRQVDRVSCRSTTDSSLTACRFLRRRLRMRAPVRLSSMTTPSLRHCRLLVT